MVPQSQADGWTLSPAIERDTLPAGDLPLCRVRLMNDTGYPWLLLVPRRSSVVEIVDLAPADRAQLMAEIADASRALKGATGCDKINVAALGNVVPQLHVHVIARFRGDAAWPKPVWGAAAAKPYEDSAAQALVAALKCRLPLG